jgi:hypothetical protein
MKVVFNGAAWKQNFRGFPLLRTLCQPVCFIAPDKKIKLVYDEILTEVVTKNYTFWDIMPFSLLKFNRLFGETSRLHL